MANTTPDFQLSTQREICKELGDRLRLQRLFKNLKQSELAQMAGVSAGTVKNIESKGQSSLESFVRIVRALGLLSELSPLFSARPSSVLQLEEMERLSRKKPRQRAR